MRDPWIIGFSLLKFWPEDQSPCYGIGPSVVSAQVFYGSSLQVRARFLVRSRVIFLRWHRLEEANSRLFGQPGPSGARSDRTYTKVCHTLARGAIEWPVEKPTGSGGFQSSKYRSNGQHHESISCCAFISCSLVTCSCFLYGSHVQQSRP